MRVLAICGKKKCFVKIRFSLHPYILRDVTLMKKLTIRWMGLLKMSPMDISAIILMMPLVMAL
jgi:hypothetical protein